MIILAARAAPTDDIRETCYQAVELCNRLGFDLDLTIGDHRFEIRQGSHPYNLLQAYRRAVRHPGAGGA